MLISDVISEIAFYLGHLKLPCTDPHGPPIFKSSRHPLNFILNLKCLIVTVYSATSFRNSLSWNQSVLNANSSAHENSYAENSVVFLLRTTARVPCRMFIAYDCARKCSMGAVLTEWCIVFTKFCKVVAELRRCGHSQKKATLLSSRTNLK